MCLEDYGNPDRHLEPPWLDDPDPPAYWCQHCLEYGTDDVDELEIVEENEDGEVVKFKCPVCGRISDADW